MMTAMRYPWRSVKMRLRGVRDPMIAKQWDDILKQGRFAST